MDLEINSVSMSSGHQDMEYRIDLGKGPSCSSWSAVLDLQGMGPTVQDIKMPTNAVQSCSF